MISYFITYHRKRSSNNDLVSGGGRDNGNGSVYSHSGDATDEQGCNSIDT